MQKTIHLIIATLAIFLSSAHTLDAQENAQYSLDNKWYPFVNNMDTGTINRQIRYAFASYLYKNMDSMMIIYRNIYNESKSIGYTEGSIVALGNIAGCYVTKGDYNRGIAYYKLTINSIPKSYENHTKIATIYTHLSVPYYFQGKYDSTAYYMYKALDELEHNKITNYAEAIHIYTNVADLLNTLGENSNALYYIKKAETIAKEQKDTTSLCTAFVSKAGFFLEVKQWDSARYYCQEILKINRNKNKLYLFNLLKANEGMGYSYVLQNSPDPEKAIPYLSEALRLSSLANDMPDIIACNYKLGLAYYQLHNYKKAETIMIAACLQAAAIGSKDRDVYTAHNYLADMYKRDGKYEKAYAELEIFKRQEDSLMTMDKVTLIHKMDIKYKVAEKDRTLIQNRLLLLKQQGNIKEKNYWIAGISLLVVLLIVVSISVFRVNQHKQKINTLNAILQGEENERTRLARELHDGIGGMLAAIKMNFGALRKKYTALADSDDFDETLSMLHTTWKEVRETAHNLMPDILVKHGLTEALQLYCEKINYGTELQVDLQLNGDLVSLQKSFELTIYRIIQELVQNIIKHSAAHNALVQINRKEDILSILVEDNGKGFDSEDENKTGIGLNNVRHRVEALYGEMSLQSAPQKGTLVYIKFFLKKSKYIRLYEDPISNS